MSGQFIQYANTLLSICITKILDTYFVMDGSVKFALATAICGIIILAMKTIFPFVRNPFSKNKIYISPGCADHTYINDFIYDEYPHSIIDQITISQNNKLYVQSMHTIKYNYNGIDIYINVQPSLTFVLSSYGDMTTFISQIYMLSNNCNNSILVYEYTAPEQYSTREDSVSGSWKCNTEVSYKTIHNTFYSNTVHDTFIDSIAQFINSEDKYIMYGDTYSTGYILYGPPGTGKTSLVKIIAKMYQIPIFTIDLNIIYNSKCFIQLYKELRNSVSKLSYYIVLFEDFDRSNFLKHSYGISIGTFLNFLDGVQSAHGRIVIITCNDLSPIEKIPAMMRPGRIDSIVEITNCTSTQIAKTLKFRYDIQMLDDFPDISITPACLIQLIKCVEYEDIIKIFNTHTLFDDIDMVVAKYRNNEAPPVHNDDNPDAKFNEFIANELRQLHTTSKKIHNASNSVILTELLLEETKLKTKINNQRIQNKIQDYLFDNPDDIAAAEYLHALDNAKIE